MGTYNLPRDVKGEGRILFIFTKKSIMWTAGAAIFGFIFYFIFSMCNMTVIGLISMVICALIGFAIGTLKVPNISNLKWTKANAGENLDDVIYRAIKFKGKGNKIYIYKEDKTDDK